MPDDAFDLDIIDFHCHHVSARFELTAARAAAPSQQARWRAIAPELSDEGLLHGQRVAVAAGHCRRLLRLN